jgi:hypothetical protein
MLVPVKADISSSDGVRSSGSTSFKNAMAFLHGTVQGTTKTVVDIYCEKQRAWGAARAAWDKAKIDAESKSSSLRLLAETLPLGASPRAFSGGGEEISSRV